MRVAGQGYGGGSEGLQAPGAKGPERHTRHTNATRRVPN
jgi:hypothetical protein